MGRYSRKDMIEFANFAKSYQSSKNVKEAYAAYLKGQRIVTQYNTSLFRRIMRANVVYVDGKTVKDRFKREEVRGFGLTELSCLIVESWNSRKKILHLKTI